MMVENGYLNGNHEKISKSLLDFELKSIKDPVNSFGYLKKNDAILQLKFVWSKHC